MKVVFIASEGVPFSKSGGLADVVGALPKELQRQGISVAVMLPKYGDVPEELASEVKLRTTFEVGLGWRRQYCGVEEVQYQGVQFYLLDNEYYFRRGGMYGYDDDAERYVFFCRAALQALPQVDCKPDVIHLHDWQTAIISLLLQAHYGEDPWYRDVKTVFTIHNLRYQGVFPKEILPDMLEVGWDYFTADGLEFYDNVNFLKAGVAYSDFVTTVSPTYAAEIQYPFFGEKLDGFLRERRQRLVGITNGIDYQEYNPETDPYLAKHFGPNSLRYRVENKLKLQQELGLPVDRKIPMIGLISRLVSQKGLDLVGHVLDEILQESVQLVVLGTGDQYYEDMFRIKAEQYPEKLSANICFDNPLAHRIYAGADLFLMPSLFEPCGLAQLIAMRYGCLPIVRETGGLKDTVQSYNEETKEGNGFSFTNYNAHDMLYTIRRALGFFQDKPVWTRIRRNAMLTDSSWERSAREYVKLYESLSDAADLAQ